MRIDQDVEAQAQKLVLNYIADREAWERTAARRYDVNGGEITDERREVLTQLEREYFQLLSRYFDDAAVGRAQPNWGDPPTVSFDKTNLVAVRRSGKRILVDSLEPWVEGDWHFRYDIRPGAESLEIHDRALVDRRSGVVRGAF